VHSQRQGCPYLYSEIIVEQDETDGVPTDIWMPRHGESHDADIRERFPKDIAETLVMGETLYSEQLAQACDEDAEVYFGRKPWTDIPGMPSRELQNNQ
jgi:hypothetical protein